MEPRFMFRVTAEDSTDLSGEYLQHLLLRLIALEVDAHHLPKAYFHVSEAIDVANGGEDGRVHWQGGVKSTPYFPSRFVVFQCKAADMPPNECAKEFIKHKTSTQLKPKVAEVISHAEGSYVLFHSRTLNQYQIDQRLESFQTTLVAAGKTSTRKTIYIFDANKIAQWTNHYLSAIVEVYNWRQKLIPPLTVINWQWWSGYKQFYRFTYQPSEKRFALLNQIKNLLANRDQVTIRIVGLSGLGKTLLALEVFRPSNTQDLVSQVLSQNVIYIDAAKNKEIFGQVIR
jgi:hypothetical protein